MKVKLVIWWVLMITKNWLVLKKHWYTILFIGWVIAITSLSLFSFEDWDLDEGWSIPHSDKITHFIFYFVFVIFGLLAYKERRKRNILSTKTFIMVFLAAALYGLIIEVMQYIMPFGRMGDFWDVLANTVGALFGALLTKRYLSLNTVTKWLIFSCFYMQLLVKLANTKNVNVWNRKRIQKQM